MSQITEVAPGIQDRGGVLVASPTTHSAPSKRKTTKWQGVPMLIDHSFRAAVRESVEAISAVPLITHNVIGTPGLGKSTIIESIGCLTHRLALEHHGIQFQVYHWGKDELNNLSDALAGLTKSSIISFDDISYAHKDLSPTDLTALLDALTTIRHRKGVADDTKTILLYSLHYSKAVPTYMRMAEYFWVLSASSELERRNLKDVFPGQTGALLNFERNRVRMMNHRGEKRWGPIGPNTPNGKTPQRLYAYKSPFAPVLYGGVGGLRTIAFPKRTWMYPKCGICDQHQTEHSIQDIKNALQPVIDSYGSGGITAVKLWLTLNGIWSYSPNVKKARVAIDKIINDGFTRDDIEKWYKNYTKSKSDKRRKSEQ